MLIGMFLSLLAVNAALVYTVMPVLYHTLHFFSGFIP